MAARSRLVQRREFLGLSQKQLAHKVDAAVSTVRRWEHGKSNPHGYQRRPLADALRVPLERTDDGYDLDWYLMGDDELDSTATARVHDGDVNRREFLGAAIAGPALLRTGTAPVPREIVSYLTGQLSAHWRADRVLGPHLLLDHVVEQCRTVTRAVASTTGALHKELVELAAAYTGLVAWLYQDMGDLNACNRWLGETLEMGHRSGAPQLVAYALTCKAMVRLDAGDGIGAVDFAQAALATSPNIGAKARAMALQHAAYGYALLGDRAAVDRLLDEVGQLLEGLATDRHPWGGDRLRHDPAPTLSAQRATCYERLGLAEESATLWAEVMQHPPSERRDRGVHLARQAIALVDAGDPARAVPPAAEGVGYLAATGSARMRQEFTRLRQKASSWRGTPSGRDLAELLDRAIA